MPIKSPYNYLTCKQDLKAVVFRALVSIFFNLKNYLIMCFILGTLRIPQAKTHRATHQSTAALHRFLTQLLPSSCAIAAPLPPSVWLGNVTRALHSSQHRSTPQVSACHQQGLHTTSYSQPNHWVQILLSWREKINLSQCSVRAGKIFRQTSSNFWGIHLPSWVILGEKWEPV